MSVSPRTRPAADWWLLLAAAGVPLSLLWDFSWESTIGIDLVWSPPHLANYLAILLAGGVAPGLIRVAAREDGEGVRLGKWRAPLGAWVVLWGALLSLVAMLFDRWWQVGYGLAAGIWHPPQLLKSVGFFAVAAGAWLGCARQEQRGREVAFALAGGVVLALIFVVTLAASLANRQHAAPFYQIVCGSYPVVLVALAVAGKLRFPATAAALTAMLLTGAMVWLLPLFPGAPQVPPIYHPRDHLLPPPFPPLLVAPALALDALLRVFPKRAAGPWSQAIEAGVAFFVVLLAVQWPFARFLLSPSADHWFFAGGGKQWPFFLRIVPGAETVFWKTPGDELNLRSALLALALAVFAARLGLWLGAWMKRLQR
jgi:hypothetical protein